MLEIDSSSCIHDRKNSFRFSSQAFAEIYQVKVASCSSSSGNGRGVVYTSQRGDSTLACTESVAKE